MKQYTIKILPRAKQNISDLFGYIALELQNPFSAKSQSRDIMDAIRNLAYLPERCKAIGGWKGAPLRRLMVNNQSILYIIKGNSVIVTHILYSRSNIPGRLGKDFSINEQEER